MKFSIITPSYNQLDWLRLCVASVRDQVGRETENAGTGPSLCVEHIIQDAGTPGIEAFAREVGANFFCDGQLVSPSPSSISNYSLTIHSGRDDGMYDAVNRGLRRAGGEICAYLNCDEQYLPGALDLVRWFFEKSEKTDVLFGAAIVVHPDGSYLCDRRVSVPGRLHTLVSGNLSIFTSSTFFRRATIVERGLLFDPSWRIAGDGIWILSLISARLQMVAINEPLASFVFTGENLSFQKPAAVETARIFQMAPAWARMGRPVILACYRLKRLLSGNYSLPPHSYDIFTKESPTKRKIFPVKNPTFVWRTSPP